MAIMTLGIAPIDIATGMAIIPTMVVVTGAVTMMAIIAVLIAMVYIVMECVAPPMLGIYTDQALMEAILRAMGQ